jgi:acetyl esterase
MSAPYIDPDMAPILADMRTAPAIDYEAIPLAEGRAVFNRIAAAANGPLIAGVTPRDLFLATPGGPLRARLYAPERANSGSLLIYAHGGGWTFGSIESHDRLVAQLAADAGMPALSVDYRLAPEHPAPAGADDISAAIDAAVAGQFGNSVAAKRIVVGGDSAGANVALGALVARRDRGQVRIGGALLFYGCFAPIFDTWSHRAYGDGSFGLSSARMRWYWRNHLGALPERDPVAAPLYADLAGLPPLYLTLAALDPLADDAVLLARRATESGVRCRLDVVPGVIHGNLRFAHAVPVARQTIHDAARQARDMTTEI